MAYFLGTVFPVILLVIGGMLLLLGIVEPRSNYATPGAVLLSGVLIALSLGKSPQRTTNAASTR